MENKLHPCPNVLQYDSATVSEARKTIGKTPKDHAW